MRQPSSLISLALPLLFTVFCSGSSTPAQGEAAPAGSPSTCGCAEELDSLVEKVEADYIGFHQLLPTLDRKLYAAWKQALRTRAAKATDAECFEILVEYPDRFRDGHLFLSEQPKLSAEETTRLAAATETLDWTEASVRSYLEQNAARLDPIEGLWYSDTARFGIVRDRASRRRDFVAVQLSSGVENWKPGQVRAEIDAEKDGSYKARFFYRDHSLHHLRGAIYKGSLLRLPPVVLGKAYPVPAGLLDPSNPRNPTLAVLPGGAIVISLPSHSGEYRPRLEQLIAEHLAALRAAPLLIVDIRGNEGGGAQTSDPLAPFYYSDVRRARRSWSGKEAIVSSPDQIHYFEGLVKNMDPDSSLGKRFAALVERMKRELGKVIATEIWGGPDPSRSKPSVVYPKPEHFAILMDRGAESAAEAFVLNTWVYDRVELFGDNSGGTIDYQSVFMVPLACPRHSLWLGYPTIAGSEFLPRGGFNGAGIPPDVRIPRGTADPIQFIVDYYARPRPK